MVNKVLLIDDDPDDREMFSEAIGEIASEIICHSAIDGKRAFVRLDNAEIELPDVIFLDVNLPSFNGWDCLKKLKGHETYKDIPVVMYSTSSSQHDYDNAVNLGALCFLTKTSHFKELKESLKAILENAEKETYRL